MAGTNSATSSTPYIPPEVVEYLERVYQDKMPDYEEPENFKCFQAGQVSVVRRLKTVVAQQSKNLLEVK